MGIAQVGREKVLPAPSLMAAAAGLPARLFACLSPMMASDPSDRRSEWRVRNCETALLCAGDAGERSEGGRTVHAHGAYLRGARTASVRRIPEPGRSAHSESGNVSGAILLRAAWPTICSGECRKNIRMREMLSFLLKAFPLPEFLFERPPIFAPPLDPVAEWTALCERRAPGWARGRRARHM